MGMEEGGRLHMCKQHFGVHEKSVPVCAEEKKNDLGMQLQEGNLKYRRENFEFKLFSRRNKER